MTTEAIDWAMVAAGLRAQLDELGTAIDAARARVGEAQERQRRLEAPLAQAIGAETTASNKTPIFGAHGLSSGLAAEAYAAWHKAGAAVQEAQTTLTDLERFKMYVLVQMALVAQKLGQ